MELIIAFILLSIISGIAYAAIGVLPRADLSWFRRPASAPGDFPKPMMRSSHWARASSIVELSLNRATDMVAHHAAAARQLEAADYALHCLLGELEQVMTTGVVSPLAARSRPAQSTAVIPASALAA